MKQLPGLFTAVRLAGLLIILILGLVSIIATAGGDGGRKTETLGIQERSLTYPGIDEQYRKDADEGQELSIYYRDVDGDGYGDPHDYAAFETQPIGYYVTQGNDCDDTNENIHPNSPEICGDRIDNDCDGRVDDDCVITCTDGDGDGYFAQQDCSGAQDCDDTRAYIHPNQAEVCWDGVDNNCNGQIDEADCTINVTDADGDGYYAGDPQYLPAADCNDRNAGVHPGAPEICGDGIDNNCDGQIDERCPLLPDTGQYQCYNDEGGGVMPRCPVEGKDFYGQDSSYSIHTPSFAKMDDRMRVLPDDAKSWSMVRDNRTGLVWEVKIRDMYGGIHYRDKRYTWSEATDEFIAQLNSEFIGIYNAWRLPTKKELINLVNYGAHDPAVFMRYFPNTMPDYYWSSTKSTCFPANAWRVYFQNGLSNTGDKHLSCYVRAVRGEASSTSFTDNGDGTVSDQITGLMWMKATADVNEDGALTIDDAMVWKDALEWCEDLFLAGYDDWRLPNIKELESIVDDDVDNPAIDTVYFPDTLLFSYWTSTTVRQPSLQYQAWVVNFGCGENVRGNKSNYKYYVRAVRGGQ